jgi:hypothetical protein
MTTATLNDFNVGPVTHNRTGVLRRFFARLIEARTHEARRRVMQALPRFSEDRVAGLGVSGTAPAGR